MKLFWYIAAAIFLAGCVTPNRDVIGAYPNNYQAAVKAHIERTFFDPYSMRSVRISLPTEGHILFRQGWIVCVEANAKNRLGGYTGLQRTAYLIHNGRVVNSFDRAALCNNQNLVFSPWPEMDAGAKS